MNEDEVWEEPMDSDEEELTEWERNYQKQIMRLFLNRNDDPPPNKLRLSIDEGERGFNF